MTDVQVSIESADGLERRIRVQVPAGRIEQEVAARLRSAGRSVKIKGFRPGKVPEKVIKQRFGPQIRQDVLQDVVQSSYSEAIAREKLRPAGMPNIQAGSMEEGGDFTYTATFEIYPEFQVQGLEKLAIDKPRTEVTDDDVAATIDKLRQQRGTFAIVSRTAQKGDRVTIDFSGSVDGGPMEGGRAEKLPIVVGEGRMLPDFEANIIGQGAGDEKAFNIRFPANYHDQKLTGQEARFELKVHEVAEPVLPPLDEEFIKGFGISTGDLAEMRRLVRENLERDVASKIQAEVKRQLLEQLLSANPIALPAVLIGREAVSLQAESMKTLGVKDVKDAPSLANYQQVAERRVRLGLIIAGLIRENELQPDQERIRLKLDQLCQAYERPEEVRAVYLQNAELMGQVENAVMEEQVIDWLIGRAEIQLRVTPFAELMKY